MVFDLPAECLRRRLGFRPACSGWLGFGSDGTRSGEPSRKFFPTTLTNLTGRATNDQLSSFLSSRSDLWGYNLKRFSASSQYVASSTLHTRDISRGPIVTIASMCLTTGTSLVRWPTCSGKIDRPGSTTNNDDLFEPSRRVGLFGVSWRIFEVSHSG